MSNTLIIILAIVLVAIIAVIVVVSISKKSKKTEEKPASILDVDNPGVPNSSESTNFSYGYEKEETVVMNPVTEDSVAEPVVEPQKVDIPDTTQSPIPGENITVEVPTTTEIQPEETPVSESTESEEIPASESTESEETPASESTEEVEEKTEEE